MRIAAIIGGVMLVLAAGYLLYGIRSTKERATAPASSEAGPPGTSAPSSNTPAPAPLRSPPPMMGAPPPPPLRAAAPAAGVGASPFANPSFQTDPALRVGIAVAQAAQAAEHGGTPQERRNAVEWLMQNGGPGEYALLERVRANDPDPAVRMAADMSANVLKSRFPTELMAR